MTEELFREDGYLKSCESMVTAVQRNGFAVDQTVFYPMAGGQPGDQGVFVAAGGQAIEIIDCYKDTDSGLHLHLISDETSLPDVGSRISLQIDWQRRHRLMRMHSCMHMLCAVVPEPVTGGSISDGTGRLDFYLPDPPDKQSIEDELNALIALDAPMSLRWITDEQLAQQPDLVRTMSVQPPKDAGRIRLIDFAGVDLQPCGGTHIARTGEIGPVRVQSIKNKGKKNRRITVVFA